MISGLLLLTGWMTQAPAAVVYTEPFTSSANGWIDRDIGEMAVSYDGGNKWMQGTFASQGFPVGQTDAFIINSGLNFIGDYGALGITQIRFDLYAEDVLPSDLFFRMVDGGNVFSHQFSLLPMGVDNWTTFTVSLAWWYGWNGPGEAAFNSTLGSVDQIEIQLTRSGTGVQRYYLDNIETLDTMLDLPIAIPEPGGLFWVGVILILTLRRRWSAESPFAMS